MLFIPAARAVLDAVLGLFHNDAMLGGDTQFRGRDQEHFQIRLPPVYILSRHNSLKALSRMQHLKDRFNVGAWSGRCNSLTPRFSLQQVYPLQGPRKKRDALLTHMLPIKCFFRVTDPPDYVGGSFVPKPLPKNGVVTLS
jgi:hypothetical protein